MLRFNQLLFGFAIVLLSWYGMMATHELGHVLGAVATRGAVTQVVLHPLSISRTDVAPNPEPAVVVWSGPAVGCLLPLCLFAIAGRQHVVLRHALGFFSGFCLIANGAYIGVGAIDGVGDCREMLRTGTPVWMMIGFGVVAGACGLAVWHRLGSLRDFAGDPSGVNPRWTLGIYVVLAAYLVTAGSLSSR